MSETAVPQVGQRAPSFRAKATTGDISLEDYRGKKVVLYFYPKADTPGCTRESCAFRDQSAEFAKRNAVVVGVSADDVADQQAFDQKYGLNLPLIADTDKKVIESYGVWGERVRPDGTKTIGVRRWTFLIDEKGVLSKVYQDVTPDTHAAEILKDLDAGA
jgi:peroxiredoxin Q/BCP